MSVYRVTPTPPNPTYYEDRYLKALALAIYYQNQCCELTEIIEMFCLDAEKVGTKEIYER